MYFGLSANPEEIISENSDFLRITSGSMFMYFTPLSNQLITAENKS